jgi:uncharacterized SAM-binding protein YcdF (DUF218 family)
MTRGIVVALAAALAVYLISLAAVVRVSREDQREPAGAIVVLGAAQYNGKPSPVLRSRLDHALALYRLGLAPQVVVTGGIGAGDRVSEATVGHQYLVASGVPDSAVVVRPEGRSTRASMRSVAEWAHERGVSRTILVSDPFHMLRLRLEARATGLEALTSPTTTSPISASRRREAWFFAAEAGKIPVVLARSLFQR